MTQVTQTRIDTPTRHHALQQELKSLVEIVGAAPLVDLLLERSFEIGATDIHFDPREKGLQIRVRVDGILHDILMLSPDLTAQIVSRIKLMAGMDITERRIAQDGHISNAILKSHRDVRVGSGPTIYGERLVLRLMPDDKKYTELDQLGLEPDQADSLKRYISAPYGMVLSVGPVGSGKSTSMYSCLKILSTPNRSVVTIEDPVERRVEGVNQIQIDPKINFNFVDALRGVLRQDPDVIMVGEIRDPETAHIATRAGLTGIRVLSTLHANDSASTVDVFRDYGIPPMFIADSINCVISQRLLRKVCSHSRESYVPDRVALQILGLNPDEHHHDVTLTRGIPSEHNFFTGYSGRTGVFEIFGIDAEIREAILNGKSAKELQQLACNKGMMPLEKAARKKVMEGTTTIEEMLRVLIST
jgi:type II secretory ATPase GspE/PulE/Tfp pilus assembly ATPase PilB-like protein